MPPWGLCLPGVPVQWPGERLLPGGDEEMKKIIEKIKSKLLFVMGAREPEPCCSIVTCVYCGSKMTAPLHYTSIKVTCLHCKKVFKAVRVYKQGRPRARL